MHSRCVVHIPCEQRVDSEFPPLSPTSQKASFLLAFCLTNPQTLSTKWEKVSTSGKKWGISRTFDLAKTHPCSTLPGEHPCRIDAKGRLMFPAKLRKQLDGVIHHGFVVNRDIFEDCLVLYPEARMGQG